VQETAKSIFWLVEKELKCLFRDPDIFIYGLVFPLVFFPIIAICISESMLWYEGMQAHKKLRVTLIEHKSPGDPRFSKVKEALGENQYFSLVQSSNPKYGLASRELDASLELVGEKFHLATNEAMGDTTDSRLTTVIRDSALTIVKNQLKERQLSDKILSPPFSITTLGLAYGAPREKSRPQTVAFYLVATILAGAFCEIMLVCGAACLCVLTAEKEQRTFYTTLLAPVSRHALVFAKLITCVTTAISSGVLYLGCLAATIACLMKPLLKDYSAVAALLRQIDFGFIALTICALVAATFLGCATVFTTAIFGKSLREGQILISFPMLASVMLAAISILPSNGMSTQTAMLPYMNLFLLVREGHPTPALTAFVFGETAFLIALCVYFVGKMMVPDYSLKGFQPIDNPGK
jgi:ABC-type Na+ efflux pump permease subunit